MNFNRKILNWSIIITLLTAYIIPGQSSDGFAFKYGYPYRFFTMYNTEINAGSTIMNSTLFNIDRFILNILIMYFTFHILNKFINKRSRKDNID
ncbi:hypothetical protein [Faecalimicrobium dakarense]|uniref:hypothetical protein n=1 Tax=Faecalimicrobium dakarense TaxID=1301100 RepID=UPI0004ADA877|nr:hypothetical protein [[Clostridium] dakarense]